MSFIPNPSADFEQVPPGTHLAACYRVLDLGTQVDSFDGKKKHKVRVTWELVDEMMKNGQPFSVSKNYTWSMHKKSALRQHLEAWRGKPFVDKDFGPGGFNIKNILGASCLLTIAEDNSKTTGELFSFVSNVGKIMKGQATKPPLNPIIYLWLEPALFDRTVFDMLHEKTREQIIKSPEYEIAIGKRPKPENENPAPDDMNDDVPF
jgi:hypothetical protein